MNQPGIRSNLSLTRVLVGLGLAGLVVAVGPFLGTYTSGVGTRVLIFVGVAVAWNILGGLSGALSLGHSAFFGVGAYAAGWVATVGDLPVIVSLLAAVCLGAASSVVLVPCFRARGFYFAILTLALAEVVRELAEEWAPGGRSGIFFDPFPSGSKVPYYLAAVGLLVAVVVTAWIRRSNLGTALLVARLDPVAATDLGVDERRSKTTALVISAALTAYFGGVFALNLGFLDPGTAFALTRSVDPVLATVLGGIGTLAGPIIGGAIWAAIGESLSQFGIGGAINFMLTGGILVLLTLVAPAGLAGLATKSRTASRRQRHADPANQPGQGQVDTASRS